MLNYDQFNLFTGTDENGIENDRETLEVIQCSYVSTDMVEGMDLFEGFDELYAITFSYGIDFTAKLLNMFEYAEIIYGCQGIIDPDTASIIAAQRSIVENLSKSRSIDLIREKVEKQELKLFVSMDTNSHEKIFVLRTKDGSRTRVITGSANMSASAFNGLQREEILYFDDYEAFEYFFDRFSSFRANCTNDIPRSVIEKVAKNHMYLRDHIEDVPVLDEAKKKIQITVTTSDNEIDYAADVKEIQKEIKELFPKRKSNQSTINITADIVDKARRNNRERIERVRREAQVPVLHLDMESETLTFCDEPIDLNPPMEKVRNDAVCLINFLSGYDTFIGNVDRAKEDYYAYFNWFFSTIFMPELRKIAYQKNYSALFLPIFGILCGPSNAGKSKLVELLSKLMTGKKISTYTSNYFSGTKIDALRSKIEGIPVMIEDLAKQQYGNNYEQVIKNDYFGITEKLTHYPAVSITANKIESLTQDATKRTVYFRTEITTDKTTGARNAKRVNDTIDSASNALFGEYVRRMIPIVRNMEDKMMSGENEYMPDILHESSKVLRGIFFDCCDENVPNYVRILSFEDYFGDIVVGRTALDRLKTFWEKQRDGFTINERDNTLIFTISENSDYELGYIANELPPSLNAKKMGNKLIMNLAKAREVTGINFKKKLFNL